MSPAAKGSRKGNKLKKRTGSAPSSPASAMSSSKSKANSTKLAYLQNKLAHASDLETKLSDLSTTNTSSSEEKASKIRFALCEILSDVLLTDPTFAMRKDCTGRLWRGCFYGRIGELRSRISREKSRQKRAVASGKNLKDGLNVVEDLEKSLQVFLGESVVLYEYLVDKYEGMLLPPSSQISQTQSHSQSQISVERQVTQERTNRRRQANADGKDSLSPISDAEDAAEYTVPSGVIPNLHRLLIHLGDLHRYATNYSKAETCYLKASKLAPGKGNPYNQLAVVAQLKESSSPLTCVALYWYARSLLAEHDPFETSRANVSRLFVGNRAWIVSNPTDPVAVESAGMSKKAALEHARAVKSAASRRFLAMFVDIHGDLFRGVDPRDVSSDSAGSSTSSAKLVGCTEMIEKMTLLLEKFCSLLAGAAFGDALLCKMIAINAFSVCTGGNEGSPFLENDTGDNKKLQIEVCSRSLALAFNMKFGAALAVRVEQVLSKVAENLAQKRNAMDGNGNGSAVFKTSGNPALRLLAPLVLLCDFVASLNDQTSIFESLTGDECIEFCFNARDAFWKSAASLANAINNARGAFGLDGLNDDKEGPKPVQLKDFEGFIGFAPFKPFIHTLVPSLSQGSTETASSSNDENGGMVPLKKKRGKEREDAYVTPEEAVQLLALLPSSTQDSDKCKVPGMTDAENRTKVFYFLDFVDKVTSITNIKSCSIGNLVRQADAGVYSWLGRSDTSDGEKVVIQADAGSPCADMDIENEPEAVEDEIMCDMGKHSKPKMFVTGARDDDIISNSGNTGHAKGVSVDFSGEEDVIVYKASESGLGPDLLVPGNLLLDKARNGEKVSDKTAENETKTGEKAEGTLSMDMADHPMQHITAPVLNKDFLGSPNTSVCLHGRGVSSLSNGALETAPKSSFLWFEQKKGQGSKGAADDAPNQKSEEGALQYPAPQSHHTKRLTLPSGMSPPPGFSVDSLPMQTDHKTPTNEAGTGFISASLRDESSVWHRGAGEAFGNERSGTMLKIGAAQLPAEGTKALVGENPGWRGDFAHVAMDTHEMERQRKNETPSLAAINPSPTMTPPPPGFHVHPHSQVVTDPPSSILPPPLPGQTSDGDGSRKFFLSSSIVGGGGIPSLSTANPFAHLSSGPRSSLGHREDYSTVPPSGFGRLENYLAGETGGRSLLYAGYPSTGRYAGQDVAAWSRQQDPGLLSSTFDKSGSRGSDGSNEVAHDRSASGICHDWLLDMPHLPSELIPFGSSRFDSKAAGSSDRCESFLWGTGTSSQNHANAARASTPRQSMPPSTKNPFVS